MNPLFKRVIKSFQLKNNALHSPSKIHSRNIKNKSLWKAIEIFALQNNAAFTWRDVKDYLVAKNGVLVDTNIWRKILKERLRYSYKRWSPRPITLDFRLLELKKVLFTVKLLRFIQKSTLLINIDESNFSSSTKSNYSWSQKGAPSNRSTAVFRGSISIISAILSNGISITGIRKGTIWSSSFIEYADHMLAVLKRL